MALCFLGDLLASLAIAFFGVSLFCQLQYFRCWLSEKRERAAEGRVFKYRRFITSEQRERRKKALLEYTKSLIVRVDDIGVVMNKAPEWYPSNTMIPVMESTSMTHLVHPLDVSLVEITAKVVVRFEYFTPFVLNVLKPNTAGFTTAYAFLVDEEDNEGLKILAYKATIATAVRSRW
jgi:hypothetical protein